MNTPAFTLDCESPATSMSFKPDVAETPQRKAHVYVLFHWRWNIAKIGLAYHILNRIMRFASSIEDFDFARSISLEFANRQLASQFERRLHKELKHHHIDSADFRRVATHLNGNNEWFVIDNEAVLENAIERLSLEFSFTRSGVDIKNQTNLQQRIAASQGSGFKPWYYMTADRLNVKNFEAEFNRLLDYAVPVFVHPLEELRFLVLFEPPTDTRKPEAMKDLASQLKLFGESKFSGLNLINQIFENNGGAVIVFNAGVDRQTPCDYNMRMLQNIYSQPLRLLRGVYQRQAAG
jgi:hypothetical protein